MKSHVKSIKPLQSLWSHFESLCHNLYQPPPLPQIFPGLTVTSSTHLHSHSTLQHPLSHPHAFLASTFPPTCCCMHLCAFTLVYVHLTNLCQLHPMSPTCHVLTSWMTVDAAQPPSFRPNELSPHSTHQTLMLAIKHCCTLWRSLHSPPIPIGIRWFWLVWSDFYQNPLGIFTSQIDMKWQV